MIARAMQWRYTDVITLPRDVYDVLLDMLNAEEAARVAARDGHPVPVPDDDAPWP